MKRSIVRALNGARSKALIAGAVLAPLVARADGTGPDVGPITAAALTVAAIGVAVFSVKVGIRVFKWAQNAL